MRSDRVDDARLASQLANVLQADIASLIEVSSSSNLVYRATDANGTSYSVRVAHLDPSRLSPFWLRLREVFGHRYDTRLENVDRLLATLRESQPDFATPTHVSSFTLDGLPVDVFVWIDGDAWEPDDFPDSGPIQKQLGRFLGRVHSVPFERIGTISDHDISSSEFMVRMAKSAEQIIARHWGSGSAVAQRVGSALAESRPEDVASRIGLMMPDISGNQFVYERDAIRGLVDVDSYVVGPVEWELSVVEMTLTHPDSFRAGYEEAMVLPRYERFRDYYRLMMYLSGPDEGEDLDGFLQRRKHFK